MCDFRICERIHALYENTDLSLCMRAHKFICTCGYALTIMCVYMLLYAFLLEYAIEIVVKCIYMNCCVTCIYTKERVPHVYTEPINSVDMGTENFTHPQRCNFLFILVFSFLGFPPISSRASETPSLQ